MVHYAIHSNFFSRTVSAQLSLLVLMVCSNVIVGCVEAGCERLNHGPQYVCGEKKVTVPIVHVQGWEGLPVVEATIDNQPVQMLLDTAVSSSTIISAKLLGAPDQSQSMVEWLSFAGMRLQYVPVYAWDTPFSSKESNQINGMIGIDILKNFVMDFDHLQQVTFAFATIVDDRKSHGFTYNEQGVPLIDVMVDDLPIEEVAIDTGAKYTVFDQTTISRLGAYVKEQAIEVGVCTVDGCRDQGAYQSRVKRFCIENECVQDLEIKYPAWNAIGNSYFANYRITFDFPNSRMLFDDGGE